MPAGPFQPLQPGRPVSARNENAIRREVARQSAGLNANGRGAFDSIELGAGNSIIDARQDARFVRITGTPNTGSYPFVEVYWDSGSDGWYAVPDGLTGSGGFTDLPLLEFSGSTTVPAGYVGRAWYDPSNTQLLFQYAAGGNSSSYEPLPHTVNWYASLLQQYGGGALSPASYTRTGDTITYSNFNPLALDDAYIDPMLGLVNPIQVGDSFLLRHGHGGGTYTPSVDDGIWVLTQQGDGVSAHATCVRRSDWNSASSPIYPTFLIGVDEGSTSNKQGKWFSLVGPYPVRVNTDAPQIDQVARTQIVPAAYQTVSPSLVENEGTFTFGWSKVPAGTAFQGPASGADDFPTFRAITSSAGGTVTSVGLALPVSVFSISGSPVTGSGTLTGAFISQTANTVFAAPNGSNGVPSFRALVGADINGLTVTNFTVSSTLTVNTLDVTNINVGGNIFVIPGGVNVQTGTSYTIAASDWGLLVVRRNSSTMTDTLPQATGSFSTPFYFAFQNEGAGGYVKLTPTTSKIDNSTSPIYFEPREGCWFFSNGTDWFTNRGKDAQGLAVLQTGSYTAVSTDRGTCQVFNLVSASGVLTLPPPGTVGVTDHWLMDVMNISRADKYVTLTPSGGATINGAVSINLYGGRGGKLMNDGGNWYFIGTADRAVVVSTGDTTPDDLFNKLVAGTGVTLTKQNPGGNENIKISASGTSYSGTSQDVLFITNGGTTIAEDNGNFMYDSTNKSLSVGAATSTNNNLYLVQQTNNNGNIALEKYGSGITPSTGSTISFLGSLGTKASPTAITSGKVLGALSFYGETSGGATAAGQLSVQAPTLGGGGTVSPAQMANGGTLVWSGASFVCGASTLATNATDGFLYIPTCAGAPTGTPTSFVGSSHPIVFDTTNSKLWCWNGSAWKGVVLT